MDIARRAALAIALSAAALAADVAPSAAAVPYGGVGQHRAVMNSIARTRQRNNAVVNSVQRNIRSSGRNRY